MSSILEETIELEQKSGVSADTSPCAEEADGFKPVLEYSEAPASVTSADMTETLVETSLPAINVGKHSARRKKRYKGVIVFAALTIIAGLGVAAYSFDIFSDIAGFSLSMKNVMELPEGANPPVFIPLDPAEFAEAIEDVLVAVPDETGLELPLGGENPSEAAAASKNYYTQIPNVSEFYTNAAQDESYVYFLKGGYSTGWLSDLMRMKISNGKTEPVPNANEVSESIYSFALFKRNIITCEFKRDTQTYAFYRVPKALEDAQLLFEHASCAIMNAYDNKIFMLFAGEGKLGIFDPETDTKPVLIDLLADKSDTICMPDFSVVNGYLYYGVMYDGENPEHRYMRYFRRSLYTGEETVLLDSSEFGLHEILNPCWDNGGNAYYERDSYNKSDEAMGDLTVQKSGSPPEILTIDGQPLTFRAITDGHLIVIPTHTILESKYMLHKYSLNDFTLELEASVQKIPYSITRDYLISVDGVHRLSDFSFIPFEK